MRAQQSDPTVIVDGPRPRPLLDFIVQGGIALALLVALIWAIFRLGLLLGPMIPFSWEKQVSELALRDFPLTDKTPQAEARRAVLQRLVDQLTPYMHFPKGMSVTVNYSDRDVVNSFATLGGNIVVYEGLIRRLPSENALAMVLGHEMSHVKHRDAISAMSGQDLVTLVVSLATGDSGLAAEIVSNIELLTSLHYSRQVEERADREGLEAVEGHYGHVNGYLQTFDALKDWAEDPKAAQSQPPEFLRDHPDTAVRIAKLKALVRKEGWSTTGPLTPLRQANFPPVNPIGNQFSAPDVKIAPEGRMPRQPARERKQSLGAPNLPPDERPLSAPAAPSGEAGRQAPAP